MFATTSPRSSMTENVKVVPMSPQDGNISRASPKFLSNYKVAKEDMKDGHYA